MKPDTEKNLYQAWDSQIIKLEMTPISKAPLKKLHRSSNNKPYNAEGN
jgi:hypothetical protein